jgi:hypothetical protein
VIYEAKLLEILWVPRCFTKSTPPLEILSQNADVQRKEKFVSGRLRKHQTIKSIVSKTPLESHVSAKDHAS